MDTEQTHEEEKKLSIKYINRNLKNAHFITTVKNVKMQPESHENISRKYQNKLRKSAQKRIAKIESDIAVKKGSMNRLQQDKNAFLSEEGKQKFKDQIKRLEEEKQLIINNPENYQRERYHRSHPKFARLIKVASKIGEKIKKWWNSFCKLLAAGEEMIDLDISAFTKNQERLSKTNLTLNEFFEHTKNEIDEENKKMINQQLNEYNTTFSMPSNNQEAANESEDTQVIVDYPTEEHILEENVTNVPEDKVALPVLPELPGPVLGEPLEQSASLSNFVNPLPVADMPNNMNKIGISVVPERPEIIEEGNPIISQTSREKNDFGENLSETINEDAMEILRQFKADMSDAKQSIQAFNEQMEEHNSETRKMFQERQEFDENAEQQKDDMKKCRESLEEMFKEFHNSVAEDKKNRARILEKAYNERQEEQRKLEKSKAEFQKVSKDTQAILDIYRTVSDAIKDLDLNVTSNQPAYSKKEESTIPSSMQTINSNSVKRGVGEESLDEMLREHERRMEQVGSAKKGK